ncbi:MAG: LAGLIDADG family homing endonuclease [Candidatus Wildermuthbacteria bacterium]|nr:LAGLIDADG family homing endonuclease [Candidatus Wildermuthbacteria bacterium]
MAYVLGFIAADGSLIKNKRGAHFLEIQSIDEELLFGIRKVLKSDLLIGQYIPKNKKWRKRFRLQIGSKKMYQDLTKLGIVPNKEYRLVMPSMPTLFLRHFIRGYFDGDGSVGFYAFQRKNRRVPTRMLLTTFTSCSMQILEKIAYSLHIYAKVRSKVPMKKWGDNAFELRYSTVDSRKIYAFLYNKPGRLFLRRKKIIFEKYLRA